MQSQEYESHVSRALLNIWVMQLCCILTPIHPPSSVYNTTTLGRQRQQQMTPSPSMQELNSLSMEQRTVQEAKLYLGRVADD